MVPEIFQGLSLDTECYTRLLSSMQVMRGAVALQEGAIRPQDLDAESRHQMPGDADSWHLLRVSADGKKICGCARVLIHPENAGFATLRVAHSAIAQSTEWSRKVQFVVEADIAEARAAKLTLVEPGGWVMEEQLRGTLDAVSIALSVFAWSQLIGGCLAYVTATVKHGSSSILKRLGGSPLLYEGVSIPRYYDPQYDCEMELLKINSQSLNPRFEPLMNTLRSLLACSKVVQPYTANNGLDASGNSEDLQQLAVILSPKNTSRSPPHPSIEITPEGTETDHVALR